MEDSAPDGRPYRLSVVMPVYNEQSTIVEILDRVRSVPIDKEIIVVDDGSTDGTRDILLQLCQDAGSGARDPSGGGDGSAPLCRNSLHLVLHERNRGKGAALRTGFRVARGATILIQDADLEYDPREYPRLLSLIEGGDADAVYGSRFLGGATGSSRWLYAGNRALTTLANACTGLRLTDMWTCYKAFRREVLQAMTLTEDRFGFDVEITARLARGRWQVREVPISYYPRTYREGKKITWRDGLKSLWQILKYSLLRGT